MKSTPYSQTAISATLPRVQTAGKLSQRERERRILFAKADAELRKNLNDAFGVVAGDIKAQKDTHEAFVGRGFLARLKWLALGK